MKQHAAATYLQLVVGCDRVLYDAEWWGMKEPPVDLIGMKGDAFAITVDIADKFSAYPKTMKLNTWKRKLLHRYSFVRERLISWGAKKIQSEIWFFGAPVEPLEVALPSVAQTLWREHQFLVEIVPSAEVQRRIAQAVETVKAKGKDIGNPFAQAILLASGFLTNPPREIAELPTQFPLELPDPYAIPNFAKAFLGSDYVVHWLGFDAPVFSAIGELAKKPRSSVWRELNKWLDAEFEFFPWEDDVGFTITPKYSLDQVVGVLQWLVHNAARALEAWREYWHQPRQPLVVEVEFLLPYIAKNPHFPPEVIEAEIVRYGGDRDLARVHSGFQNPNPEKRFYRGYLRIVFQGPYDPAPSKPKFPSIEVPLRNPFLPRGTTVSLSLLFPPEFAGYFLLTFNAVAQTIRPLVERFREL
ncbi:MAG: hypothetical protein NZ805_13535 [Armatimonadetes bacterium]|nr:hypothetical protein [Armatimonadota bacterium]